MPMYSSSQSSFPSREVRPMAASRVSIMPAPKKFQTCSSEAPAASRQKPSQARRVQEVAAREDERGPGALGSDREDVGVAQARADRQAIVIGAQGRERLDVKRPDVRLAFGRPVRRCGHSTFPGKGPRAGSVAARPSRGYREGKVAKGVRCCPRASTPCRSVPYGEVRAGCKRTRGVSGVLSSVAGNGELAQGEGPRV